MLLFDPKTNVRDYQDDKKYDRYQATNWATC